MKLIDLMIIVVAIILSVAAVQHYINDAYRKGGIDAYKDVMSQCNGPNPLEIIINDGIKNIDFTATCKAW